MPLLQLSHKKTSIPREISPRAVPRGNRPIQERDNRSPNVT